MSSLPYLQLRLVVRQSRRLYLLMIPGHRPTCIHQQRFIIILLANTLDESLLPFQSSKATPCRSSQHMFLLQAP